MPNYRLSQLLLRPWVRVYKGRLKTGEEVAVKVQRPGLNRRISLDIYIMRLLAGFVQDNFKQVRSNLRAIIDELAERIFEETNYNQEGRNADKFKRILWLHGRNLCS